MKLPFVSRARFEQLAAEKQALEDRLRSYQSQNDYLREALDEARGDATASREMVADWLALQLWGHKIFGTGLDLPSNPTDREALSKLSNVVQTGRTQADKMTEQFMEQWRQKLAAVKQSQEKAIDASANNG